MDESKMGIPINVPLNRFKEEFDKFISKEDAKNLISRFKGVKLTEVGGGLYADLIIENLQRLFDEN